jgi:hypothetical protein
MSRTDIPAGMRAAARRAREFHAVARLLGLDHRATSLPPDDLSEMVIAALSLRRWGESRRLQMAGHSNLRRDDYHRNRKAIKPGPALAL